jgi:hypothetical protein
MSVSPETTEKFLNMLEYPCACATINIRRRSNILPKGGRNYRRNPTVRERTTGCSIYPEVAGSGITLEKGR